MRNEVDMFIIGARALQRCSATRYVAHDSWQDGRLKLEGAALGGIRVWLLRSGNSR